ncbi:hypothetical protein L4X63_20105 [Geomonas sp. Red32]|uniref:hypothetical protein n=1 Tax=Geomonas sp. Red32 TaxID=2912856 RepID=UPI00202CE1D3|nr:hypothetical protein [Geomonas sp. Red32]MCM0083889.1 hypothetical protein [Geomonas sp. Red32]
MKATVLAAVIMLIVPPCAFAWQQHDLEMRTEMFNDNEGSHSFGFDEVFHWKDKESKIGLGATETLIHESGRSRVFSGGLLEGYQKVGVVDFTGKVKLIDWNGGVEAPATLGSSQALGKFRLEETVDHGTIDSVRAYDARIDYWSAGGSVDFTPVKDLTVTGGYWRRWSSDSNSRDLFVGRAAYSLTDNFLVQYRYRGMRNQTQVPEYYSPRTFDQHAIMAGYADSFFDRLSLKLWAGPVSQYDGFTTSYGALEDLKVSWKVDNHWLLSLQGEADQVGTGYQYIYSTLSITYGF